MKRYSSLFLALLLIGIPLKADKKWDKKKIITGASAAGVAAIAACIWWWLHKKEEPSPSYQTCQLCSDSCRKHPIRQFHCGHRLCHSCMDKLGIECIKRLGEGDDQTFHCPICREEIKACEIYANMSEELQDLIMSIYFV